MSGFFIFNGQFKTNETAVIGPESRALRYGDGLFETIRVTGKGQIPLADLHYDRAFQGLEKLSFTVTGLLSRQELSEEILALCRKNNIYGSARVRLVFFRGDGGVFDAVSHQPNYLIQAWPLPENYTSFDPGGLQLALYDKARKSMDEFANLKSNNFLTYILAGMHARKEMCNESIVLNNEDRIADATTANVFLVKQGRLITNPLSEGPVAGVMRKYLIENLPASGYALDIKPFTPEDLNSADEIFLSNAVSGIRWVSGFNGHSCNSRISQEIYERIVQPLFTGESKM